MCLDKHRLKSNPLYALGEALLYVYESIRHIAAYTIKPHIDSLKSNKLPQVGSIHLIAEADRLPFDIIVIGKAQKSHFPKR